MFNLNDILQAAQGGQGISNLAQQFGISPDQAQSALNSMLPSLSQGLQGKMADPSGLGSIIGSMTHPANQAAFNDPNATAAGATPGGDLLGNIFGSSDVSQIAQEASKATGIPPAILASMLPVVASMAMGGMFKSMQNQGMGGMLGQLTNVAGSSGGLGSVLGQVMNAQPGAAGASSGGLMGMLSGLLGGLMGGGNAAAPAGQSLPGGLNASSVQAGIDALSKMMKPGV
ncbi:MAG: DUF937 domain-containing protein [Hyphomicrobiales bacterium]|nr:DUF937 domain-containing protein [Hyphomicrobiales bacterium]MDE2114612.1 DUF937 domain-containing protein [Hyphomicrobiales bacterium]